MPKKIKLLRGIGKAELNAKLNELKVELIKLNAQVATGTSIKNPSQVRETKKNIARINTLLKSEQNK